MKLAFAATMIRPRYFPDSIVAQLVSVSAFSHSLGHSRTCSGGKSLVCIYHESGPNRSRAGGGSPARPERRLPKAFGRPNACERGAWLPMPHIAAPRAPGRNPWETVSRGHYQGLLVSVVGSTPLWPALRLRERHDVRRKSKVPRSGQSFW